MARQTPGCIVEFENGFSDYERRVSTFDRWPGHFANIYSLARLGFSYTGADIKVQCQFCKGKLYWEAGHDPYPEHKQHFPECAFILQLDIDNRNPIKPAYEDLTSRISTFPTDSSFRTPNELATAGFFYIGPRDRVRCFHCGITLRNWDKDDDPFNTHWIYSPACAFIRNVTDFQKLGISVTDRLAADEMVKLRQLSAEGMVNDPKKQMLIDDINSESVLFQQLLCVYDPDTIVQEMTAKIQRTGRNFDTFEDFKSCVDKRRDLSVKSSGLSLDELKAENMALRKAKTCQQCMDRTVSVLFLPCRHLVRCAQCAQNIRDCPKCSTIIQGTVPVRMR